MDLSREVDLESYTAADVPKYPAQTLLIHVLWKGVELGATVGMVIAPLLAFSRAKPLAHIYHKVLINTTGAATVASLGMLAYREFEGKLTVDGVDDRAYRISQNVGQETIDRMARMGACVGATAGALGGSLGFRSVATGGLTGVAVAVLLYGFDRQLGVPLPPPSQPDVQPLR